MSSYLPSFIAIVLSYLLGSLSFAVIVSKTLGMADPRSYGSKNPGATNVLRSGNKGAALATLLLDALKGWLPVFLVHGWATPAAWARARRRWPAWRPSSAISIRCSSASRAARAWRRPPACWSASTGCWAWRPAPPG